MNYFSITVHVKSANACDEQSRLEYATPGVSRLTFIRQRPKVVLLTLKNLGCALLGINVLQSDLCVLPCTLTSSYKGNRI